MAYISKETEEYTKRIMAGIPKLNMARAMDSYKIGEELCEIKKILDVESSKDIPFQGELYDEGYMLLNNSFVPLSEIRRVSFKEFSDDLDWRDMDVIRKSYWAIVIDYGSEIYTSGKYRSQKKAKAVAEMIMKKALPFIYGDINKPMKVIDV